MELRQLCQFVAIAETGSFSLAAERLCMALSPVESLQMTPTRRKKQRKIAHTVA